MASEASDNTVRRSSRSRRTSAAAPAAGDDNSESSDASYHSAPETGQPRADPSMAFPYHDESTVAMRLNPELDPNRHSREERPPALSRGPPAAQPGNSGAASGSVPSQLISAPMTYTPVPPTAHDRRRASVQEVPTSSGPAQTPQPSTEHERLKHLSDIFDDLRRTHSPETFAQVVASLTGVQATPSGAPRQQSSHQLPHPSSNQTVYYHDALRDTVPRPLRTESRSLLIESLPTFSSLFSHRRIIILAIALISMTIALISRNLLVVVSSALVLVIHQVLVPPQNQLKMPSTLPTLPPLCLPAVSGQWTAALFVS